MLLACASVSVTLAAPQLSKVGGTYNFDDSNGLGRKFDGIGGLSGGGATSKLLVNYPQQQRDEILDYLFKPNFGASLHILKVEIGGDVQSTDGTEASHMHYSWEENYDRGYEWWLMVEAKKRNPNIKLYALPWGFPGWIGQGTRDPYHNPELTADYVIRWINGAKVHYGLDIDFVGIWNERPYNTTYVKILRKMLDVAGFNRTRIVASDDSWNIAHDMLKDSAFADAIDYIGCHYPGTDTTEDAIKTGKQLWASEDYSTFNNNVGGGCWARILNKNYAVGYMTSTISWNLIASYYNDLPFSQDGLMTAMEPWSGNYVVSTPIWLSAHTTQFTEIGWTYLQHGSGVGLLKGGGSYVALVSPDGNDLTIIIETMSHDHSVCIRPKLPPFEVVLQTMKILLMGSFANITQMNLWYSKLRFDGQNNTMFLRQDPVTFVNGTATLSLGLDEVYTLTTLSGGQKGQYPTPPPSKPFPLPYFDDFESYDPVEEPFYLAQQTGSFEIVAVGGDHGKVARQMVLQTPVMWCEADNINRSLNVIGASNWTDIYLEVDAKLGPVNETDGVFVAARVQNAGCDAYSSKGVFFFLFPKSQNYIVSYDLARTMVFAKGSVQVANDWNTLSILVKGKTVTGAVNGNVIFTANATKITDKGFSAIGTDSYGLADFDNLKITSASTGEKLLFKQKKTLYFKSERH